MDQQNYHVQAVIHQALLGSIIHQLVTAVIANRDIMMITLILSVQSVITGLHINIFFYKII
jgi:hypothetical protein